MRQVRLALGPDALIISNRRVEGGVEIMAADPNEIPEVGGAGASSSAVPSPEAASARAAQSAAASPRTPTPMPAVPPLRTQPAAVPSLMSPLGAYAAAFRAAYGPVSESAPAQPSAPAAPAVPVPPA